MGKRCAHHIKEARLLPQPLLTSKWMLPEEESIVPDGSRLPAIELDQCWNAQSLLCEEHSLTLSILDKNLLLPEPFSITSQIT